MRLWYFPLAGSNRRSKTNKKKIKKKNESIESNEGFLKTNTYLIKIRSITIGLEVYDCLMLAHIISTSMKKKNPEAKMNFSSEGRVKRKKKM